ncbi:uncharacterized protein PV06_04786 [Exophiala oligosperma]|uniref:F-box domain-containing protein n=2 Tax=Exophiala oligosperma TaxID=215243 RepID=A0A0D2AV68_9EURO|nr:uncharacterized protein PV06_04786 [Exophiala oligosperma]KIW43711.1 hypothetical protein PV06_04786 [Exophiala oligosperma]
MSPVLDLAPEILHQIFIDVQPTDLGSLSMTCQYLNQVIRNDERLWRHHYLSHFDPPQQDGATLWMARTTRLIKTQKILESDNESVKDAALQEVLETTLELIENSPSESPKNTDFLATLFKKDLNISTFLCKSGLFSRAARGKWTASPNASLRQLSARLHVLGGINIGEPWPKWDDRNHPNHRTANRDDGHYDLFAHLDEIGYVSANDDDDDYDDEDDDDDEDDGDNDEDTDGHESPGLGLPSADAPEETSTSSASTSTTFSPQPIRYTHPFARSKVYDLRRYTAANMWGPFTDDGSGCVDWEKVQAIMIIIGFNYNLYSDRLRRSSARPARIRQSSGNEPWDGVFSGIATDSYVSCRMPGQVRPSIRPDLDALDPYGVTGSWMRVVCFLDYNDLYAFNFKSDPPESTQDREPLTTREAFRLLRLQLNVTSVEDPNPEDGDGDMPVVHFQGTSRSTSMAWDPNANSQIRGTARKTASGAIRWTTFSLFHGEERWRSEGVQIGGLRSARGILGNWFDKDYDDHGPAGPTAFWKISDDLIEESQPPGNQFAMLQALLNHLSGND